MQKKKKILFTSHESELFGATRSLLQIVSKINEDNDILVLTYGKGEFVEKCNEINIPIKILQKNKIKTKHYVLNKYINYILSQVAIINNFFYLVFFIKTFKPDVIYANTVMRPMPVIVGRLLNIRTITHVREAEKFIKPISKRSIRRIKNLSKSDSIICVSKATRDTFIKYTSVEIGKCSIIHNGIDTSIFKNCKKRRNKYRAQNNIDKDKIVIGFLGNICARKGTDIFLKAAEIMLSRHNNINIKYMIVGGNNNDIKKLNINVTQNLQEHLIIIPFIDDVRPAYDAMDIFCMTSRADPFPRTNIEASSMEKAIVSTKVDGCLEIFTDNINALMIEPDSPEQLVEAWVKLIEDKVMRERLGKAARENVIQNFSEQQTIKKIMNVIDQM